jgi:hypothetical protein
MLPILGMRIPLSAKGFPLMGNPLPLFVQAEKGFSFGKILDTQAKSFY